MQTDWKPEHSQALREHLARGLSYAQIARAINAAFNTAYTRNAAIGRAMPKWRRSKSTIP
jgi:GcrA cell cycle regulator